MHVSYYVEVSASENVEVLQSKMKMMEMSRLAEEIEDGLEAAGANIANVKVTSVDSDVVVKQPSDEEVKGNSTATKPCTNCVGADVELEKAHERIANVEEFAGHQQKRIDALEKLLKETKSIPPTITGCLNDPDCEMFQHVDVPGGPSAVSSAGSAALQAAMAEDGKRVAAAKDKAFEAEATAAEARQRAEKLAGESALNATLHEAHAQHAKDIAEAAAEAVNKAIQNNASSDVIRKLQNESHSAESASAAAATST